MRNSDYIPENDGDFNVWQLNLLVIVGANLVLWGILAADYAALQGLQALWKTAWDKASVKQTRSSADVQEKNDVRAIYEKALRGFNKNWLLANPLVSNADKERMGLPIYTGERTKTPVPTTRPSCTIDFSMRFQHIINFFDEATPASKAKPFGVHGLNIYMKIGGTPPTSPDDMKFKGTDTCTPYTINFNAEDAGKTVYYWLRWVNKLGEEGPWSLTFSAVIVG